MDTFLVINIRCEDVHVLEEHGYGGLVTHAVVTGERNVRTLVSVLNAGTEKDCDHALLDSLMWALSPCFANVWWGLFSLLCLIAGLSFGLSLYFRNSLGLIIEAYSRRYCARKIKSIAVHLERKRGEKPEGEEASEEASGKSSSSSSGEGEDNEVSVRERKEVKAEGTDAAAAAPETEGDGENKEHKE